MTPIIRALPPGSVAWLLANEVRLGLRGMRRSDGKTSGSGIAGKIALVAVSLIAGAVVLFGGLGLGFLVAQWDLPVSPLSALIVDGVMVVLFTLMLSQTINLGVQALYERGDLDLLLSSPLRPRVVLTVRALAIAVVAAIFYLGLVTPFVLSAAVFGAPQWLALWVLLLSLAFTATALGILITMGLFALIGPRRTRTVAQVMAAVVGGLMFALSQAYNLTRDRDGDPSRIMGMVDRVTGTGLFDGHAALTWPVRALTGEALPILVIGVIGLVLFLGVIQVLGPRFASDAAEAAGNRSTPAKTRGADKAFADGLTRAMVRKELRLLARDPQLISQVLLRIVYLIPLGFVMVKNAHIGASLSFGAGAIVIMAGQLAGSFAWIAISAEDSPDLLRSAPIDQAAADRAKLIAALMPTLILTGLAVAGFAVLAPLPAIVVFLGCICSAGSSGLIQVWRQKPSTRKAFRQQKQSSFLVSIAEFVIQAGWAAATGLAVAGWIWALIPAIFALLATLALRRSPQKRAMLA